MSKHSENIKKEDSESLTVKLDRIMIKSASEDLEGSDVATICLPGVNLQIDTDKIYIYDFER